MAVFSINQVRQLYVANTITATANTAPSAAGELAVFGVTGKSLYFKHVGKGGLVCSDKIDVDKILSASQTAAAKLDDKLHSKVVTITNAIKGQVYSIKLNFRHYIGLGEEDTAVRVGTFRATNTTAADIAKGLAISLNLNLGNTYNPSTGSTVAVGEENLARVTVSGAAITISEVSQTWKLGKFPVSQMPVDVTLGLIVDSDHIEVEAGTVTNGTDATDTYSGVRKLADLEYFCLGARGDEYRGMGYPVNFDAEYFISTATADAYDIIDIHYAYVGSNESVQKSEKTISIVVPAGNTSLKTLINTMTGATSGDAAYIA